MTPTMNRPKAPSDVAYTTGTADDSVAGAPMASMVGVPGLSKLPGMPKVGLPEQAYLRVAHGASKTCDDLVHEAAKVGQYLTLATRDPDQPWPEKLKAFRHALKHHTRPPEHADDVTKHWFHRLGNHVRKYAGAEALRLCREEDERYEMRRSIGQTDDEIADDAEAFFDGICPNSGRCPPIYLEADWHAMKEIRDKWI